MGAGSSSSAFQRVPAERLPREPSSSNLGQLVQLVGTVVAADGAALSSPFNGDVGPAVRVMTRRQTGAMTGFKAQAALDFYVASGADRIRAVVPDVESWTWRLQETHVAHNIQLDVTQDVIVSGGRRHEHRLVEPKPDALHFWERLNGGHDPVSRIQFVGTQSEDWQRPRQAHEQTLKLGDAVSVVGFLNGAASGELTLSATWPGSKGRGCITNDPAVAKSLRDVRATLGAAREGDNNVRVVPMARHASAKGYAGIRW